MAHVPLFALNRPLKINELPNYQQDLEMLQGNILKGHGRKNADHVFLTFKDRQRANTFIGEFANGTFAAGAFPNGVTSAAEQARQASRRRSGLGNELFVSLCLSAQGYEFLAPQPRLADFSVAFRNGMKTANDRFHDGFEDPLVSDWDETFQDPIHAMVLIAHDDEDQLADEVNKLSRHVVGFASVFVEVGKKITNNQNDCIEHFGYVDAISQPIFFESDLPSKNSKWNPGAGPNLVLVKDPLGNSDECGSYLVFRKLEQNVAAFRAARHDYAASLGLPHNAKGDDSAGALMIGRFEDGTPRAVAKAPKRSASAAVPVTAPAAAGVGAVALPQHNLAVGGPTTGISAPVDDFNYNLDPFGLLGCPLDAHIRIVNPRGGLDQQRARRIARRGMTYGPQLPTDQEGDDNKERGLLFQCYQSDLVAQFEYLQAEAPSAKMDKMTRALVTMNTPWMRWPVEFKGLVTLRGGEYLFAPSISVLKRW